MRKKCNDIFQESVYIGTEESVIRVPAQHCGRLHSQVACQNAMDPYCGWNELKEQCTPAPNHDPLSGYWKQSVTQCPVLTDPGECLSGGGDHHHHHGLHSWPVPVTRIKAVLPSFC